MKNAKKVLFTGVLLILLFAIWTILVQTADVKPSGVNETDIGLEAVNVAFFEFTGVHLTLYVITDWLGLVPLLICAMFGILGMRQMLKRNGLFRVHTDMLILGIYYLLVIFAYLIFETVTINYRPVLINGNMESSYPSSTTLLVLAVMPTLWEQADRRVENVRLRKLIKAFVAIFSVFMVAGRLTSGVHWLSDIIGGILISVGMFCFYKGAVILSRKCGN